MISFILAMDKNQLIGRDNDLPWNLPADLAFFKRVTMGQPIIMGRKTHESIGRPLPGRDNIILTRDRKYKSEGCIITHTVAEVLKLAEQTEGETFVIGGAEIFEKLFDYADRLYITEIEEEFEGDTYFPPLNSNNWQIASKEKGPKDDKNPYDYYFVIYERKKEI